MDPSGVDLPSGIVNISTGRIFAIFALVGGAWAVAALIRLATDRLSERFPNQRLLVKRIQPLLRIVIYAVAVYLIIGVLSPEDETLYAILGSMALALGLAAKDLLNDLIGGIVVLFDRSFQIGDRVQVGNYYGEVVAIGLRSTKLITPDDSLVTVPNSTLLASGVSNTNAGALECQVVVNIFLPGAANLDPVEAVAREAVLTSRMAALKKPVVINVKDEFDETHVSHVIVKAYVFDTRYENAFAADLTRRIHRELHARDLVPFDTRFDALKEQAGPS